MVSYKIYHSIAEKKNDWKKRLARKAREVIFLRDFKKHINSPYV